MDKLQKLAVDYYDRQPVGVLMSRVAHDTEALYGFIHQFTSGSSVRQIPDWNSARFQA